jgi:hypothetical protein
MLENLTPLTLDQVVERLTIESGCGCPSYTRGALKALTQHDLPFVIRKSAIPGSKKPKFFIIYELFKLWILYDLHAVHDAINAETKGIRKFLQSLTKKPIGRPSDIQKEKDKLLKLVGGE